MTKPMLSPFIVTSADPLDHGKTLIWLTSEMGGTLLRLDSSYWQRFCDGSTYDASLVERFCVKHDGQASSNARQRLLTDHTRSYTKIIMPSAACPHGCCLPKYGDYCGQQHDSRYLASDKSNPILLELAEAFQQNFDSYNIGFFGAEPLTRWKFISNLVSNISLLSKSLGKSEYVKTKIITSGFLLTTDVHKELRTAGIDEFEITLDGPQHIHDARRPLKSGKGTFATIIRNLELAKEVRDAGRFLIRVNLDSRNLRSVFELLEYLLHKEILPWAGIYVAPIRNWGNVNGGTKHTDMRTFAKIERSVFSWLLRNGLRPQLLPAPLKRTCVALAESPSVLAPNGEKYFCTETPLSEASSPKSSLEWADVDTNAWREGLSKGAYPCATCEILPVCGGSCPKDWLKGNLPCPSLKFNASSRLQLFSLYDPTLIENYSNSRQVNYLSP